MATLLVSKGTSRNLPSGGSYEGGVGWDPAVDQNTGQPHEEVDLDLWVVRVNNGEREPICWANEAWHRPDLGFNIDPKTGKKNPFVATPELDVIHKGDDQSGGTSATGYDEKVVLDLSKAPAGVTRYDFFVTYFEEPANAKGLTLGMATNIVCGIKDVASGHELKVDLGATHGFDVSAHICAIVRGADGKWTMHGVAGNYAESMLQAYETYDLTLPTV